MSATNVARAGKQGNICVGNNVSSFARALRFKFKGSVNRVNHPYINLLIQFPKFSTFHLGFLWYQLGSSFPVFGTFGLTQRAPGIKITNQNGNSSLGTFKESFFGFCSHGFDNSAVEETFRCLWPCSPSSLYVL